MSQYVVRNLPVWADTFSADLVDGTIVKYSSGYIAKITADTDSWIGVVSANNNAGSYATSGSVNNVTLRGGGVITRLRVGTTVTKGQLLSASGSATFGTTARTFQTSGSSGTTGVYSQYDAVALAAGVAGDIIDGLLY